MAQEVRNTLSRVRGLRVVSDSSSFAVAGERISATDMARRLGADLLLDGSLTRDGDAIRLTAELVDGWSGVNLWTGSKDGPATDLDLLRQLMAAAVFEQIVGRIGPNRVEVLAPPPRGDPRVYRLVLEALEILQKVQSLQNRPGKPERLVAGDRAKALLDQALAIEPSSPTALSLMGRLTSSALTTELDAQNLSVLERQERAADYLRRALAANPDTVVALGALGEYYRRYEWRWTEAQTLMERALALDPNNADTHLSYSFFLTMTGRCVDAVEHARLAVALDPEFGFRTLGIPRALKCAGQHQEAADLYAQALRPDPGNLFVIREVYLYHLERRDVAALRALVTTIRDTIWKGAPPVEVAAMLDRITLAVDALEGRPDAYAARIERDVRAYDDPDAEPPLDSLSHSVDTLWVHALEFAHAGKPGRAVDMLERATAGGSLYIPENLPYGENEFTPEVRADPRYERIWRRDPRLADLAKLRLAAAHARQMVGRLENGSAVAPKVVDSSR